MYRVMLVRARTVAVTAFVVLLATAVLLAALSLGRSSAQGPDAGRKYLAARHALIYAGITELPATRTAVNGEIVRTETHCAGILRRAPRGRQLDALLRESAFSVTLVAFHVRKAAFLSYARATAGLSWHDPVLARLIASDATEDEAFVRLAYPDLCATLHAWVASGFHTLPSRAVRFLSTVNMIERAAVQDGGSLSSPLESSSVLIRRRLKQDLPEQYLRTLRDVERLEDRLGADELALLTKSLVRLHLALGK